jgi:hypothetical protein
VSSKGARTLSQSVCSRGGYGRGASHNHVLDGSRRVLETASCDNAEFVRKKALFNEQHGISCRVEGDGAKMPRAATEGDIH